MSGIEEKARIWAEIDLDALIFNFRQAQTRAGSAKTLAVLKADAYGHGAVECARALEKAGADYFAVAAPEEGLQLRAAGIQTPVLLLGVAPDCMVEELARNDIELAVNTVETAQHFSRLAGGHTIKAHVQLDTGMSRLGLETFKGVEAAGEDVIAISKMPNITLQGLFTHLCVSDTREEDEYTKEQIRLFKETADYVKARGVDIPLCHCANSAAIIRFPEARFDMVREGIMLYGVSPETWMDPLCELRPVMSLRTRIMQVKTIAAGTTVGYGRTWKAPRDTDVATIGVGYADGLLRANSNRMSMIVNGQRVNQIGRVCMDISMLDVTGVPCARGDVVTVMGQDGNARVSVWELTENIPTIPHEMLCNISKRVPRIYYQNGKAVARTEYIR